MLKLKIGSRKSDLALAQTYHVRDQIRHHHATPLDIEILTKETIGDVVLDKALDKIGDKGLFTKELEEMISLKLVDFVVHSLKDMPTSLPPGMVLVICGGRESAADVAIIKNPGVTSLSMLPPGSVIGTSSNRRMAQLKHMFPKLKFSVIRGNIHTRIRKLDAEDGEYNAIILAKAGLQRCGLLSRVTQDLCEHYPSWLYSAGQGALAVECLESNHGVLRLLQCLTQSQNTLTCLAERYFLSLFHGGCHVPVGVRYAVHGDLLHIKGGIYDLNSDQKSVGEESIDIRDFQSETGVFVRTVTDVLVNYVSSTCLCRMKIAVQSLFDRIIRDGGGEILISINESSMQDSSS